MESDSENEVEEILQTNEFVLESVMDDLQFLLKNLETNLKQNENQQMNTVEYDEPDEWLQEFSVNELTEFVEMIYDKIDEYLSLHVELTYAENFNEQLSSHIVSEVENILEEIDLYVSEEEIKYVCNFYIDQYFDYEIAMECGHIPLMPCRSYPPTKFSRHLTHNVNKKSKEKVKENMKWLQSIETPDQRTIEWYEYKKNIITASVIWQVFLSESSMNRLIYEKCNITEDNINVSYSTNPNSPMHWGNKYEYLTIMLYEKYNHTKIGQFGCIKHTEYDCIGASPDGINIDEDNELYGRMIEIKNIFNRDITGIPKFAYWIQMQIQMETCKLNECDFIESRFKEYYSETDFYSDVNDKKNVEKGVVLRCIHKDTNEYKYEFMPLDIILTKENIQIWVNLQTNRLQSTYIIDKVQYWYLDEWSCVLVLRNELWFKSVVQSILNTWEIIKRERVTGYLHRMPTKRKSKLDEKLVTYTIDRTEKSESTYNPEISDKMEVIEEDL